MCTFQHEHPHLRQSGWRILSSMKQMHWSPKVLKVHAGVSSMDFSSGALHAHADVSSMDFELRSIAHAILC